MDLMSALKSVNKHVQGAKQQYQELSSDFKLPIDIYILKVSKFEMGMINDSAVLRTKFLVISSPTKEYDGFTSKETFFLSGDYGIGKALVALNGVGVNVKNYARNEQFINYCNEANNIKDTFEVDVNRNKADYVVHTIMRNITKGGNQPIGNWEEEGAISTNQEHVTEDFPFDEPESLESQRENQVVSEEEEETLDERLPGFNIPKEEIIDDFKEEEEITPEHSMYDDNNVPDIPNLPGLPIKTKKEIQKEDIKKGPLAAYRKRLIGFAACNGINISNIATLSAQGVVDQIKTLCPDGFEDLEGTEKTLLKKVGLESLIK